MDESHVSFKDSSFYNWSRHSYPAVLGVNHDSLSMSFVIAISGRKVEGLMESTKWIIAKTLVLFINDIWEGSRKWESKHHKIWFIFGNAFLHSNNQFVNICRIKKSNARPYLLIHNMLLDSHISTPVGRYDYQIFKDNFLNIFFIYSSKFSTIKV